MRAPHSHRSAAAPLGVERQGTFDVAEATGGTRSYGVILVTGMVSLLVGVLGGVLVNRFTERRPGLEYELVTPAVFTGEKESIGVLVLNVSNPAQREVENVTCILRLDFLLSCGSLGLLVCKAVRIRRSWKTESLSSMFCI